MPGVTARAPPYSLVGLRSMPSLKRRSTCFSGESGELLLTFAEAALFARLAFAHTAREVGLQVSSGGSGSVIDALLEAVALLRLGWVLVVLHLFRLPAAGRLVSLSRMPYEALAGRPLDRAPEVSATGV